MVFRVFASYFWKESVLIQFLSYISTLKLESVPEIVKGHCQSKN